MNPLPSAEAIRSYESKGRPLEIEPWMAAHLSRVWQAMKTNVEGEVKQIVAEKRRATATVVGTQEPHRSGQ